MENGRDKNEATDSGQILTEAEAMELGIEEEPEGSGPSWEDIAEARKKASSKEE